MAPPLFMLESDSFGTRNQKKILLNGAANRPSSSRKEKSYTKFKRNKVLESFLTYRR